MCGIVGYVGHRAAGRVVIDGLNRLDCRSSDSAGVALYRDPGRVEVIRTLGAIAGLSTQVDADGLSGRIAVGHTREATHGSPSVRNAHPHLSRGGRVALVHNGIIENHAELRREMEAGGADSGWWLSDTDTETLAHWIERCWPSGGSLLDAVRSALRDVVGNYAVVALDTETGEMVIARCSSPLAVGIGDFEVLVASNAMPFVEHVKDIIYLSDHDIARIVPRGKGEMPLVELFSLEFATVGRLQVRMEPQAEELQHTHHLDYLVKLSEEAGGYEELK